MRGGEDMVYHSVVLNVQKNTSNCVLDIIEKDKNSHQLLIKLVCSDGHYYNISGYTPEIEFYDNTTNTTVLTTSVDIVNSYRGYLSYILGERILMNPSRYTVTLRLYEVNGSSISKLSSTFILNVLKDSSGSCCPCPDIEVTISKEFYDELKCHLDNRLIHVSESDRAILSFLTDNLDTLVTHQEFDPVKQNVENLNDITTNLTTNVTTLSTNVTNVISTVESLARQVENYTVQIQNLQNNDKLQDTRIGNSEENIYILSSQVKELQESQESLNWVNL